MDALIVGAIVIVFIVVAANIFMVLRRLRTTTRHSGEKALEEKDAAILRDRRVQWRLEQEMEDAERRVELRRKTWDLYEQVRRNAGETGGDALLTDSNERLSD